MSRQHLDHVHQPMEYVETAWTHPVRGRVVETLCLHHDRMVLTALRALGIGCTSRAAAGPCSRCSLPNYSAAFRDYINREVP